MNTMNMTPMERTCHEQAKLVRRGVIDRSEVESWFRRVLVQESTIQKYLAYYAKKYD